MTVEEAQKLATILSEADGGCRFCVEELVQLANEQFPEIAFTAVRREGSIALYRVIAEAAA